MPTLLAGWVCAMWRCVTPPTVQAQWALIVFAFFALLLIDAPFVRAVPPLPSDKRIPAQVIAHLSAPADQPMHMPNAVTVDSKGNVFVADGAQDRIVRFTAEGRFAGVMTAVGDEKMSRPIGMKVDGADRLWIADTGNHRVLIAQIDAKLDEQTPLLPATTARALPVTFHSSLIEQIPLPPGATGRPSDPTDIALTPDGKRCYIVDMGNQRILQRENATGKFTSMGSGGKALGEFQWPFMACVGDQNYVFITEAIGARVQVISPGDKWAGAIGSWGVELGQLYRPKGIATDRGGRLFVSDSTTNVIQVFSPLGAIEGALCDSAGNLLRFNHPMGLSFDKAGRLYVVELSSDSVAIVSLGGSDATIAPPAQASQPSIAPAAPSGRAP